jgi:hypothetical protein
MTVSACRWHSPLMSGDPAPQILFAHLLALLGRRSSLTNFKSGNMKASTPLRPRRRKTARTGDIHVATWVNRRVILAEYLRRGENLRRRISGHAEGGGYSQVFVAMAHTHRALGPRSRGKSGSIASGPRCHDCHGLVAHILDLPRVFKCSVGGMERVVPSEYIQTCIPAKEVYKPSTAIRSRLGRWVTQLRP